MLAVLSRLATAADAVFLSLYPARGFFLKKVDDAKVRERQLAKFDANRRPLGTASPMRGKIEGTHGGGGKWMAPAVTRVVQKAVEGQSSRELSCTVNVMI